MNSARWQRLFAHILWSLRNHGARQYTVRHPVMEASKKAPKKCLKEKEGLHDLTVIQPSEYASNNSVRNSVLQLQYSAHLEFEDMGLREPQSSRKSIHIEG